MASDALREETRLRRRAERRESQYRTILESMARGRTLSELLHEIVELIEQDNPGSRCSILLLDARTKTLRHGAAPRLPDFYNQAIDGLAIGPEVGCCGAAAYTGKRVVVEDIETHPYWRPYVHLARQAGLRSCWSEPILSNAKEVLGTFAIYHDRVQQPSPDALDTITIAAYLASIAIERAQDEDRRRAFDLQLQHAQKLESLGVMAGGIAHDFNNLLTSVLGHADLALRELPPASPARELIEAAVDGARRAAELTQQMLAYSGRGRFVVAPLDLSAVARDMLRLLEVSISKKCSLVLDLDDHLPAIEADAGQIRQVVMNLAINASEAIGEASGTITIRTGVSECDREELNEFYLDPKLEPGTYVFLEVGDDGCGMSKETISRMFEPFFTTKFTGRGLGLSALLGIVRGHHGAVRIYSELGRGTTFRVLFPVSQSAQPAQPTKEPPTRPWRASGTALIVDDDASVAALAGRMFEAMGFQVLFAVDGQQAIDVYATHAGSIRIVLLDVTMPKLDGEATLRELRARDAQVRVILSSGYDETTAMQRIAAERRPAFIQKPYRFQQLAAVVRAVLESRDTS
ncbi:MAG: response regulator [Planctomycetes bacterium]|nr:response regulator [Planctomycetota bacterium]